MTPELEEAVQAAEAFVARHGFTSAGHPSDESIETVDLFDGLYTDEAEMLAARKGSLGAKAFGVSAAGDGWYVLFSPTDAPNVATAVLVQNGNAERMIHANFRLDSPRWRRLPPN